MKSIQKVLMLLSLILVLMSSSYSETFNTWQIISTSIVGNSKPFFAMNSILHNMRLYAFATIYGDGHLSEFSTIVHTNWAYPGSSIATDTQYIYVTGGAPALSTKPYYNYVWYGKLKEDGSLDLASYGSNPYYMKTNRAYHGSVVYNGRLYVLGGWDFSGEPNQTVEYGVIQPDHSVGPFQYLTPLAVSGFSRIMLDK